MPAPGRTQRFQSTPARGGRRVNSALGPLHVSIHARTRRATRKVVLKGVGRCFNPRPHAAGDCSANRWHVVALMFQSTPARGGRLSRSCVYCSFRMFQSTPARGGRHEWFPDLTPGPGSFNPRPHAAGDAADRRTGLSRGFQSTPARGGRPSRFRWRLATQFQSTPARGGRRGFPPAAATVQDVSIHARTRRATAPTPNLLQQNTLRQPLREPPRISTQ